MISLLIKPRRMKTAIIFSCFAKGMAEEHNRCPFPEMLTEPERTGMSIGEGAGSMHLWNGNDLCLGKMVANKCQYMGKAYGSCIQLGANEDAAMDCVDTFIFSDGSTLISQGIELSLGLAKKNVVIGGSGCYKGAKGLLRVEFIEDEDAFQYDLSKIENRDRGVNETPQDSSESIADDKNEDEDENTDNDSVDEDEVDLAGSNVDISDLKEVIQNANYASGQVSMTIEDLKYIAEEAGGDLHDFFDNADDLSGQVQVNVEDLSDLINQLGDLSEGMSDTMDALNDFFDNMFGRSGLILSRRSGSRRILSARHLEHSALRRRPSRSKMLPS